MRKYIYIIVSLLLLTVAASVEAHAGNDVSGKNLCFVYIAHSENTSVNALSKYIDARYQRALDTDDFVLVLYLANGTDPLIVKVNTEDDNRNDIKELERELKEKYSHKVDAGYDLKRIVGLFEELDFMVPYSSKLKYEAVDWHFHVTSDFWAYGYNESLISSLCFVMGTENLKEENFRFRCYFSQYDELVYDKEKPFGAKNYSNIDFRPYFY